MTVEKAIGAKTLEENSKLFQEHWSCLKDLRRSPLSKFLETKSSALSVKDALETLFVDDCDPPQVFEVQMATSLAMIHAANAMMKNLNFDILSNIAVVEEILTLRLLPPSWEPIPSSQAVGQQRFIDEFNNYSLRREFRVNYLKEVSSTSSAKIYEARPQFEDYRWLREFLLVAFGAIVTETSNPERMHL